jgi:hypothetical protein
MMCPVCFNAAASDDTIRTSLNLGIFVLLGVTACVLACFLWFIISIARRSSSPDIAQARAGAGLPASALRATAARRSLGEGGKTRPYAAGDYTAAETT